MEYNDDYRAVDMTAPDRIMPPGLATVPLYRERQRQTRLDNFYADGYRENQGQYGIGAYLPGRISEVMHGQRTEQAPRRIFSRGRQLSPDEKLV